MASLSPPRSQSGLAGALRMIANYDWWLMLSSVVLVLFGMLSLYSIDHDTNQAFFRRQATNLVLGVVPFLIFLAVKPSTWRRYSWLLYAFNIALLILVLLIGEKRGGDAQRWITFGPIRQFQPSELSKLLLALTLAAFWANRKETVKTFGAFALSFIHVLIPMALIFKQPHLGATLAVLAMWFAMAMSAGVKARYIGLAALALLGGLVAAVRIPGILTQYQLARVMAMIHPTPDNKYQVNQGVTATGSGGLLGKGYLKGDMKAGKAVPEQETDFIVTVLGEEGGLFGIGLLLSAYAVFFFRIWWIMVRATDQFHKGVLAGVLTVFAFHTVANLGMVYGMLPVVGLWLPFLSYGGTAMWLCLACVALVLNIKAREDVGSF